MNIYAFIINKISIKVRNFLKIYILYVYVYIYIKLSVNKMIKELTSLQQEDEKFNRKILN